MTISRGLLYVVLAALLLNISACQKNADEDNHVFTSQEMALKKAKQLQKTLTDKIKKDAERLQQSTQ